MASINGMDSSGLQQLIDWYQRVTRTLEHDDLSSQVWVYGSFEDGAIIPAGARVVYRERIDLQTAFTDPFAFSKNSYQSWYFNQGPKEYPELFDKRLEKTAIDGLSSVLSPGFQAGSTTPINIARVSASMLKHLRQPSRIVKTLQKSIEILRTDGFKGIAKRLQ